MATRTCSPEGWRPPNTAACRAELLDPLRLSFVYSSVHGGTQVRELADTLATLTLLGDSDISNVAWMLQNMLQNTLYASGELTNLLRAINITLLASRLYSNPDLGPGDRLIWTLPGLLVQLLQGMTLNNLLPAAGTHGMIESSVLVNIVSGTPSVPVVVDDLTFTLDSASITRALVLSTPLLQSTGYYLPFNTWVVAVPSIAMLRVSAAASTKLRPLLYNPDYQVWCARWHWENGALDRTSCTTVVQNAKVLCNCSGSGVFSVFVRGHASPAAEDSTTIDRYASASQAIVVLILLALAVLLCLQTCSVKSRFVTSEMTAWKYFVLDLMALLVLSAFMIQRVNSVSESQCHAIALTQLFFLMNAVAWLGVACLSYCSYAWESTTVLTVSTVHILAIGLGALDAILTIIAAFTEDDPLTAGADLCTLDGSKTGGMMLYIQLLFVAALSVFAVTLHGGSGCCSASKKASHHFTSVASQQIDPATPGFLVRNQMALHILLVFAHAAGLLAVWLATRSDGEGVSLGRVGVWVYYLLLVVLMFLQHYAATAAPLSHASSKTTRAVPEIMSSHSRPDISVNALDQMLVAAGAPVSVSVSPARADSAPAKSSIRSANRLNVGPGLWYTTDTVSLMGQRSGNNNHNIVCSPDPATRERFASVSSAGRRQLPNRATPASPQLSVRSPGRKTSFTNFSDTFPSPNATLLNRPSQGLLSPLWRGEEGGGRREEGRR